MDNSYATLKVCRDKIYEYLSYYIWGSKDAINNCGDMLKDYSSVVDIEKYEDEGHGGKRIFEKVGFFAKYNIFFSEPTHIIDNIFLGSAFNAASYKTLKKLDIKIIFNITHEISPYYQNDKEFIYHQYGIYDNNQTSIEKKLDDIYNNIIKYDKKSNIFIHCYMGASRSVSVVIYYLMKKHYMSFDDAIKYIKDKRPIANISYRFAKDLAKSQIIYQNNKTKDKVVKV